ncbi:MAG: DUF2520 domain-containing protein [Bacteroidales bacterium]|nr:DUF2520 domain-containing protein [Bacteroidales bacterium]
MNILVIGLGNVAYSLVPALKNAGHNVENVSSREKILVSQNTDITIICTADKGIEPVAEKLKTDSTVLHTSGSTDIEILKKNFENCGVIYPIQTFSKGKSVDFKSVPLLIEASNESAFIKTEKLAKTISEDVRKMTSEQRKFLHLAAVFACNFTNHFIAVSKVLTETNGVDFNLLKPLIKETFSKAESLDPILCQTGPAQRNDSEILNLHLEMLKNEPLLKKIYSFVSENIMDFKTKYTDGIPRKTTKN